MQFSLAAEISRQKSTASGRSSTSPRSPVSVRGAQSSTARKSGTSSRRRKLPACPKERKRIEAEVVPAALHHRHVQVAAERPGQQRDVLVDELLLQVLGAGGDHHAPAQLHRGQQVGERLAGARAGLGQQHAAVAQRPADGVRQRLLRGPLLVAGQDARQGPAGTEEGRGGKARVGGHGAMIAFAAAMSGTRKTGYALAVLFAINAVNFFDRQILPALGEPIRREWGLSDAELGALGTAFTLLYAFAGVPLGRLSDRASRTRILSAGVFVWSLLTGLSGRRAASGSSSCCASGSASERRPAPRRPPRSSGTSSRRRGGPGPSPSSCWACPSGSRPATR